MFMRVSGCFVPQKVLLCIIFFIAEMFFAERLLADGIQFGDLGSIMFFSQTHVAMLKQP